MSESTWLSVRTSGMDVPTDRPLGTMTAELVQMLGDPSPRLREELAYPILTAWLQRGVYDDLLSGLGDGIVSGLGFGLGRDGAHDAAAAGAHDVAAAGAHDVAAAGDSSVIRRSYSALMLAEIVGRDNDVNLVEASSVLAWGDAATSWYVREFDHRGWIPEIGWAHAIAHGADLLAALARSRHFGALELTVLLDVVADRVLAPTAYAWRHGEDDRLAFAVMTLLHRNALDTALVEPWLARLGAGLQPPRTRGHLEAEWPTTEARNTSAFLRALHLQLALGVQGRSDLRGDADLFAQQPDDRADLLLAVLDQIRAESPWLYRPTSRTPVPPTRTPTL